MNRNRQVLRAGVLAIMLAMALRLIDSGIFGPAMEAFAQSELAAFLIYAESGRRVEETTAPAPDQTEPAAPTGPAKPLTVPDTAPVFTEADLKYVQMHYSCSYEPDLESLLTGALDWDLTGDEPTVLILHTHGTEAFTPTADSTYQEDGGSYRTRNDKHNVVGLRDELARLLESGGIKVVHDRSHHDYPNYTGSYENSRSSARKYLEQYPSIKLVIDLHRDAVVKDDGSQWKTSATVNGQQAAQVMFVVGTDTNHSHPHWKTNLSIALKLHTLMEKAHSGVTRPIDLRSQRFNHDLSTGAMIAEIGASGNTYEQAKNAVSVLAEAILQLAHGANQE